MGVKRNLRIRIAQLEPAGGIPYSIGKRPTACFGQAGQVAGRMFWFMWKKFSGSYLAFNFWSRS